MRRWFWMAAAAVLLAVGGCGGGNGSTSCQAQIGGTSSCSTSGSTTTSAPTISVTTTSTTVTNNSPATITATVLSAKGSPLVDQVVDFSVNTSVGALSATSALTDGSGQASVQLSPAATASTGADNVIATTTVAGTAISGQVGYQLSAVSAGLTTFTTDASLGGSSSALLPAYGQTQLTLTMTGVSTASPAALTVTSGCASQNKATLSPASVTNTSGTQTFIYNDNGCGAVATNGYDTVQVGITGSSATLTTRVYVTPPLANSISFVSATPTTIYLQGTGYAQSSTVVFKVVDSDNNPLPNQQVGLTLTTFAGGLTMDNLPASGTSPPANGAPLKTKTTDANGLVSVIVNSGTVPTPVRVQATLSSNGNTITTVSSSLAVATGMPTQLGFSLAQTTINIEGYDRDGTTNTYTIHASDRSGNPVPDGTSIVFWAESGQIQSSQVTSGFVNGSAVAVVPYQSAGQRPFDGRATILAYAIGEESFVDLNMNNQYDLGEPFMDMGDIFKDWQLDDSYDSIYDEVISLQTLGTTQQTTCNTSFNATYPQFNSTDQVSWVPGTCDGVWSQRTYVRQMVETVLSTSGGQVFFEVSSTGAAGEGLDSNCKTIPLRWNAPYLVSSADTQISASATENYYVVGAASYLNPANPTATPTTIYGSSTWHTGGQTAGVVNFWLADLNGLRLNPMAAGTTVSASTTTNGFSVTVAGGSPVPNTAHATPLSIGYNFTSATAGVVTLVLTSPSGIQTVESFSIDMQSIGTNTLAACLL